MAQFSAWPSIDSFSHVVRGARKHMNAISYEGGQSITYRGKIKLHGTNAGIHIEDGKVTAAQKRTSLIDYPAQDNAGFASWVMNTFKPVFDAAGLQLGGLIIHGEWAGGSIQKGVALNGAPKHFAVFALEWIHPEDGSKSYTVEPEFIRTILGQFEMGANFGFYILDWATPEVDVDLLAREQVVDFEYDTGRTTRTVYTAENFVVMVNQEVDRVEKECPWTKEKFGISGIGEGLVFFPTSTTMTYVDSIVERLMFKAKGAEHQVVKTAKPASVAPLTDSNLVSLIDKLVSDNRLQQGLTEALGGVADKTKMPDFLKWVGGDVMKECMPEIIDSGFEWKQAAPLVNKKAARWLMQKSQEV